MGVQTVLSISKQSGPPVLMLMIVTKEGTRWLLCRDLCLPSYLQLGACSGQRKPPPRIFRA